MQGKAPLRLGYLANMSFALKEQADATRRKMALGIGPQGGHRSQRTSRNDLGHEGRDGLDPRRLDADGKTKRARRLAQESCLTLICLDEGHTQIRTALDRRGSDNKPGEAAPASEISPEPGVGRRQVQQLQ